MAWDNRLVFLKKKKKQNKTKRSMRIRVSAQVPSIIPHSNMDHMGFRLIQ